MTPLPNEVADVIAELEKNYPRVCIGPQDRIEDAHRYAGAVELVESLRLRLDWTLARDPLGKVLPRSNTKGTIP